MNTKGFTLIELIAVIALLGLITTIGVTTYISYYDVIKEKNINNNFELIKSSAIDYYNDTLKTTFMIDDLLTAGYLKPNQNNSYYIDDEDYRCYAVNINVKNDTINHKKFSKITAVLGKKYVNDKNECDKLKLEKNEIKMTYQNGVINITIPANSTLTLISNLGHFQSYVNNQQISQEYNYNLSTQYEGNIIISATIVDSEKNVFTKSIRIEKGE